MSGTVRLRRFHRDRNVSEVTMEGKALIGVRRLARARRRSGPEG
jgi:hypothetical protein